MPPTSHRTRLSAARLFAVLAPTVAVLLTSVTFVTEFRWVQVAAAVGAIASAVLGGIVFQLERRLRVEVAAVRAAQAAAYDELHERYSTDHRAFTAHIVGMLDEADRRMTAMRRRIDDLEGDAAAHLDQPGEDAVDTSELPTVVELLSWEERARHGLLPEEAAPHGDVAADGGVATA